MHVYIGESKKNELLEDHIPLVLTILIETKMRLKGCTTSCPCVCDPYSFCKRATHVVLTVTRKVVEEILHVHANRAGVRIIAGIEE